MGPEVIVPVSFILTIGGVVLLKSRIGEAIADRIRGAPAGDVHAVHQELDQLRGEVDALRGEMAETQERLDFAERLLTRPADTDRLPQ